jgi:hypothetical protein
MTNYPLANLTGGIKLSGRVIDIATGTGWFYIDFPNGFKENENAMAGFGSTTFTTFSTASVDYIRMAIVDDNHFVINWEITGYKYRQIFNTDGTNSTPVITIEASTGASHSDDLDVACGNSTLCASTWYNYNTDNTRIQFFDNTGANVSPAYTVQHVVNSLQTTITFLNSSDVLVCFHATPNENCSQYRHAGNGLNPTYIGSAIAMTGVGTAGQPVYCKVDAFNSTAYALGCGIYPTTTINATTLYTNGTVIMPSTLVESGTNQYPPTWVSTNNWQNFTIFWHNALTGTDEYAMYYSNGTQILAPTTIQSSAGTATGDVMSGSFNSTDQLLGWWQGASPYNFTFGDYGSAGTATQGPFKVDNSSTGRTLAVATRQQAVGLRFCSANDTVNQYLIYAYANSTTLAGWLSYYSNGTLWNGVCPSGGQPPVCTDNSFSVVWNGPLNNTWNQSQTITHSYTPTWGCSAVMANCSLWTNKTGTFTLAGSNATPLTNNSINTISFNYAVDSPNIWSYINCTNSSGTSNFTSNNTIKIDTTAPTTPTITLASSGETWINLNIGSCTDAGSGVLKKLLYRNGTNIANLTSETTYNDTSLSGCATAYSYLLGCLDNVGWYGSNSTQLNTNTNHSTAPTTPSGLANTTISNTCIDLDWNDCTATGCSIDTYRVFRNSSLAGANTTSFFHECGLTNCTSYGYTIDVNDTGGLHSANSSTFVYTTNGCYVAPPADTSAPNVTLVSLYFLLKGFGVLA